MIQGGSQAVNVSPLIGLSQAPELLRRRIAYGTKTGGILGFIRLKFSGGSEVDEGKVAIRLQDNVGRFHIPVNNRGSLGMQIGQNIQKLFCPFNHIVLRKTSLLLQKYPKRVPLHIVHNNEEHILFLNHVYNGGKVRMAEALQKIRFHNQALLHRFKVHYTGLSHLFYRPGFVGLLIYGHINRTHSAMTDFTQYFIFSV